MMSESVQVYYDFSMEMEIWQYCGYAICFGKISVNDKSLYIDVRNMYSDVLQRRLLVSFL
jgi:hypothetical protein